MVNGLSLRCRLRGVRTDQHGLRCSRARQTGTTPGIDVRLIVDNRLVDMAGFVRFRERAFSNRQFVI